MKKQRQADLIDIISNEAIKTQEDLTDALLKRGHDVTQATVSRDIKEMKILKIVGENGISRYFFDKAAVGKNNLPSDISEMKNFVIDVISACNIIVVKTTGGMAQGVAAAIDELKFVEVLGTIAGDDTIMVACRDFEAAEQISGYLKENLV